MPFAPLLLLRLVTKCRTAGIFLITVNANYNGGKPEKWLEDFEPELMRGSSYYSVYYARCISYSVNEYLSSGYAIPNEF